MRGLRGLARRMGQGAASGGADKGAGDGGGHGLSGAVVPIQGAERALRGAAEGAAFLCSELFSRGSKRPHLQPPRTKVAGGDPRGISKGAPGEAARARPPGDGRSPFSAFVCCPSLGDGGWLRKAPTPPPHPPSTPCPAAGMLQRQGVTESLVCAMQDPSLPPPRISEWKGRQGA